jgi:benzoyl-CoA reductase/2-hydroxyglutaryl-CoA dehydratase subunit BcrC/BadD/HgdB
MKDKLPCIFLAHPQYRRPSFGLQFTVDQYMHVKQELEKISGTTVTDDALREAIKVMNRSRAARRNFVKLAGQHPDVISAVSRSAVLRSAWFMEKAEHTQKLEELNAQLAALPESQWKGKKVVTSGIICDNPKLLQIFDENQIAIVADDVAQESRPIRVDAAETGDPMMALAQQYADQDYDVLLYDESSNQNRRGDFVVKQVKDSGAQGLVLFMQQFCDPEEMEYPYLKKALDGAGIPHIKLGVDQQMRDFGQASTAIQAFADVL